jgi:acetyl esterase/lipase
MAIFLLAASLAAAPGVKFLPDLEYAKVGARSMMLDLYLPDPPAGKVPVIVWIHGGGWMAGDRKNPPGQELVRHGYALASIEYRLSTEATFPAQIYDLKAAVRWLRAHAEQYSLDSAHFGTWGHSAGGHLAALLGASGGVAELEGDEGGNLQFSSAVQCVCDWAGPTDFTADPNQAGAGSGPSRLIGCAVGEHPEVARKACPVTYVGKSSPPFQIVHGDLDRLVPLGQAQLMAAALTAAGVPVELLVRPFEGHGISDPTAIWARDRFFERWLKGVGAGA